MKQYSLGRWLSLLTCTCILLIVLCVPRDAQTSLLSTSISADSGTAALQGGQASSSQAPGDLGAIALSTNQVHLSWSADTPGQAAGPRENTESYTVRRDGTSIAQVVAEQTSSVVTYIDDSVKPATAYSYTVEAGDSAGHPSRPALQVEVKTPDAPERADTEAPTAPEDLTAALTPDGYVLLDWFSAHDDTGVTAYKLDRNDNPLAMINHGAQSYADKTISARKLTAIREGGNPSDARNSASYSAGPGGADTGTDVITYTYSLVALDVVGKSSESEQIAVRLEGVQQVTDKAAQEAPQSNTPAAPAPASYTPQLRRYPYLTDLAQNYATVNWATDRSATTGSLLWGQVALDGSCNTTNSAPATKVNFVVNSVLEYQWQSPLTLAPNTQYCYRVYLGATDLLGSDPSPRFWTQVPAGAPDPFSFAVFGDWGEVDINGQNPSQADLMRQIGASGARFALTVGDNAYPSGTHNNYGDLVEVGADLSAVFGPNFWARPGSSIPIFPSLGNHGLTSSSIYHPHLLNFPQDRSVAASGGRNLIETYCCLNDTNSADYPSVWYAFDAGVARFYVLDASWSDSNVGTADVYKNDYDYHWTPTSDEYRWLENDLATHPGGLKFAFFHFPIYSANSSAGSDTWLQGEDSLEGLLSRYGVNIAFSGHAHVYERNLKPDPDSLITYLTGAGGSRLQTVSVCGPPVAYAIGWSYTGSGGSACGSAPVPTDSDQVFHFLLVQVNGSQVTVIPTDSQGRTFDVQTYQFVLPPTQTPTTTPTPVATSTGTPTPSTTATQTTVPTLPATASLTPQPARTSTATLCAVQFTDVHENDYFHQAVVYLYCEGAISGYADNTFRPYSNTTRGQLSKIMVLAEDWTIDTSGGPHFSDLPPSNPFYGYIETAYHHGVISGYSDGTFRWGNNVTRAQLSKIVVNARGWPIDTSGGPHFGDVPTTDPFYGFVETAFNHRIITGYGDGTFKPGNNATRGQISKIVYLAVTSQ